MKKTVYSIDTEHGLITVAKSEYDHIKDTYIREAKTTDDGCHILRWDEKVHEDLYPDEITVIGSAIKWQRIKDDPPKVDLADALKIVQNAYKTGTGDTRALIARSLVG